MSSGLQEIKGFIDSELKAFDKHFKESMKSNVVLLDKITHYIVKSKGKQVRPMFVFLSAKLLGETNETTYIGASLVELLHTATLVHDDVVDDSYQRRGFFSINALWKNKIAVLVGDFLLSKGLLLALDNEKYNLLQILSTAVKDMSEGELLQMEKARRLDITEDIYFDIITKKTASLISAACGVGAASVSNQADDIRRMRELGETIGICFQIKDDLFDYGMEDVGKPLGIDIKEKKMTLPLIHALSRTDASTKRKIIKKIKNRSTEEDVVREVISFVHKHEGLSYTESVMKQYQDKARKILHTFEACEARNKLESLLDYITDRKV